MIKRNTKQYIPLSEFITEYSERNTENKYSPVAVGKYGIRSRESIYSKELASDYSKNKLIYKNTLTVGMGSKQIDVGVLLDNITYSVSPAYHTYKITNINAKYLDYCIQCRNQDMFNRFVKRGSRQGKNVDLKRWLTYEIPVYDEKSQAEIVDYLNRAHSLVELRQNQLEKMDVLVKSRFVEMFGGPVSNPLSWEKRNLKEVCVKLTDGTHFSPESFDIGKYKYITAKNIKLSGFDFSNITYVPEEVHKPIYERCNPEFEDVLYIKDGATTGIAMVNTLEEEFTLLSSVALLKQDRNIMNGYFLTALLNNEEMYLDIRNNMGGAAITRLTIAKLNLIKVIVPPIELQEQFAAFVEQVDKSKLLEWINLAKKSFDLLHERICIW